MSLAHLPDHSHSTSADAASKILRNGADSDGIDALSEGGDCPPLGPSDLSEAPPARAEVLFPPRTKSKLTWADEHSRRGFAVFPLKPNEKKPAINRWQLCAQFSHGAQIREWWRENPDYNIGIGTAGLLVIDVDPDHGGRESFKAFVEHHKAQGETLPETYVVETRSGGRHLYYRLPKNVRVGNSVGQLGKGIDTRGGGKGYVVAPGSTMDGRSWRIKHGARYSFFTLPEAPEWLINEVKKARPKAKNAGQRVAEETPEAVERAWKLREKWPAGDDPDAGDEAAYRHAAQLADLGLDKSTTFEIVGHWNGTLDDPMDLERIEQKVENAYAYRQNPIGVRMVTDTEGFEPIEIEERSSPQTGGLAGAVTWDEPANLWADASKPPELPAGVVPDIVERLARDAGRRLGVEPGAVAAALVTTLGALIPAGNELQMRQHDTNWTVRPILWAALIGEPGTNKTATTTYAIEPVKHVEKKWCADYAEDKWRADYAKSKRNEEAQKAAGELFEAAGPAVQSADDIFKVEDAHAPFRQKEDAPVPFRQKKVNDATTEAIGQLLEENPSGLLFHADELSGWIDGMDTYHARGARIVLSGCRRRMARRTRSIGGQAKGSPSRRSPSVCWGAFSRTR
jgi:hypothetical protein